MEVSLFGKEVEEIIGKKTITFEDLFGKSKEVKGNCKFCLRKNVLVLENKCRRCRLDEVDNNGTK